MDDSLLSPRVNALFSQLLDLPAGERTQFLDRQCEGDEGLRNVLERLLRASESEDTSLVPGGALAGPVWSLWKDNSEAESMPTERTVGAYRLLRKAGDGGMASVYLAERADGVFEQQVALKLLRASTGDPDSVRRFNQERQLLARLVHPNIARLYDGGVTDDGEPYLVLEYVDGMPVDEYCRTHSLTTHRMLELVLDVAHAVAYAHRNLILHRDIKPSNVLVNDDGEVRLLDFGIAKIIDGGDSAAQAPRTVTAVRPMTPRFASPEQISGEPMTTASDVYQLGCLLYLLLSGRSPHGEVEASHAQVVEHILSMPPPKPSSVSRRSGLRGDLDVICMKALSKEPDRRYATAREFIEDIERHLADLPIKARGDSALYRLRRFAKRHALTLAAATAVVSIAVVQTLYYTARLADARDQARAEADKAEQVSRFLTRVFTESDPNEALGEPMSARELLDSGVARIEQDLAEQPETQAHLYLTMGKTYSRRGHFDSAEPLLEKSLQMRQSLLGDRHPDVYESLFTLGVLNWRQGKYAQAEDQLREASQLAVSLFGENDHRTLDSRSTLGLAVWRQSRFAEAQAIQEDVVDKTRAILGEDAPALGQRLNNLGGVYWMQSKYDLAAPTYAEALRINRMHHGAEHPSSLDALNNLAMTRREQGRYAESTELLEEVIVLRRRVLGEEHPRTLGSISQLAQNHITTGAFEAAADLYQDVLAARSRILGDEHPDTLGSMADVANALVATGRLAEAAPFLATTLDRHRSVLGETHYDTLMVHWVRGTLFEKQRAWNDALEAYRTAARGLTETAGADHSSTLRARIGAARMLTALGRTEESGVLLIDVMQAIRESESSMPLMHGLALAEHGRWLAMAERPAEAREQLEASLKLLEPFIEQGNPDAAIVLRYQADLGEQRR